jgi:hypothetical protein
MMVAIFAYIERIVNMVRPRKLLYMAVGKSTTLIFCVTTFHVSHLSFQERDATTQHPCLVKLSWY